MPNFNRVILAGHLTRDVEVKYLQSGTAVASIGMAVNNRVKRGDDWEEEPVFVDVTAWGRTAENAGKFLSKGSPVLVEGKLKFDQWEDRDGNRRSKLTVTADNVQFLGSKGGGGKEAAKDAPGRERNFPVDNDDEVPF